MKQTLEKRRELSALTFGGFDVLHFPRHRLDTARHPGLPHNLLGHRPLFRSLFSHLLVVGRVHLDPFLRRRSWHPRAFAIWQVRIVRARDLPAGVKGLSNRWLARTLDTREGARVHNDVITGS